MSSSSSSRLTPEERHLCALADIRRIKLNLRDADGFIHAASAARLSRHSTPESLLLKCEVHPRHLRRAVGQEISRLESAPGQVLYGLHRGPVCDLDNVLVCDFPTSAFAHAVREGLRLERGPTATDSDHHYCYGLVPAESPLRYWQVSRTAARVEAVLNRRVRDATDVWHAVKRGIVEASSERPDARCPLLLSVTLDGPTGDLPTGAASVLKALVDGTTCALQMDDRTALLRSPAACLAKYVRQSTSTILGWLADQRTAVLGRPTLPLAKIDRYGKFSWDPCDERYAAVDVRLRRTERNTPLRLRAAVSEMIPAGNARA